MASKLRQAADGRRLEKAHEPDPASISVVQPQGDAVPGPQEPAAMPAAATASAPIRVLAGSVISDVPDPHATQGDGELSASETAELQVCEGAVHDLQVAFWRAGKALETIRNGRLYRDTHRTFEDYVEERWGMSRPQAYRLIDAWPLAQDLSPIGDRLVESHVRVLLPVASQHGSNAAIVVYQTIAQAEVTITAKVLQGAVAALPEGPFNAAAASERIRAFLAGDTEAASEAPQQRRKGSFGDTSRRIVLDLSRAVSLPDAIAEPAATRVFVSQARELLNALEAKVSTEPGTSE